MLIRLIRPYATLFHRLLSQVIVVLELKLLSPLFTTFNDHIKSYYQQKLTFLLHAEGIYPGSLALIISYIGSGDKI